METSECFKVLTELCLYTSHHPVEVQAKARPHLTEGQLNPHNPKGVPRNFTKGAYIFVGFQGEV